jgi:uncharacterized membrane protein (DUF106 family)
MRIPKRKSRNVYRASATFLSAHDMTIINSVLRSLFDGILYPLRELPPIVGVILMSLVTAMGMLLVFRYASDQDKLAQVKNRIHACIFEIRLFNDDLGAIMRAQMEILRHNLTYLRLTIKPMLWMIVPIVLLIAQLQFHYGYRGLTPGDSAVVSVTFGEGPSITGNGGDKPATSLVAPSGLVVETPAVWVPSLKELSWRIGAERRGVYELEVVADGETYAKSVVVSDVVRRRSPSRLESGFLNQLLYPAEDPLPKDGSIVSIEVGYRENEIPVFGYRLHWLIVFFILSVVFAFSLKSFFGVTI